MDTFRKNGFIKIKMPIKWKICLNLLEKINFYQCDLTSTEYEEYHKLQESAVHGIVLKIPAQ